MGWNEVDNKTKRRIDSKFVSCDEDYELKTIKNAVLEEFPHFPIYKVEAALKECCKAVPAPRPRRDFLKCLERRLGF